MDCKLLSMDQRRILLLLLMRYHSDIARVPRTVERALELSVQSLKQGDDTPTPSKYPDSSTIKRFSHHVQHKPLHSPVHNIQTLTFLSEDSH